MKRRITLATTIIATLLAMNGCRSTRNVPQDQYLLSSVKIVTQGKPDDINKGTIKRYVRQLPNRRILGLRIGLGIYNLARPTPRYKFGQWLHRIGDPPVIYDAALTEQSLENIRLFLNGKGFYNCIVQDTTYKIGDRRIAVEYRVSFGTPTLIDTVRYAVQDTAAARFVHAKRHKSVLRPGERLDNTLLDAERTRVANLLRAEGFYNVSSDNIGFLADTLGQPHHAALTLRIPNPSQSSTPPSNILRRYRVDSLTIYPNYSPQQFNSADSSALRTTHYHGLRIVSLGKPSLRPRVINEQLALKPDSILRSSLVERSNSNLQRLSAVQYTAFDFQEKPNRDTNLTRPSPFHPIDGNVYLVQPKNQAYNVEVLLTTSGSIGMEGNVSYTHRNLFRGAEKLEISFTSKIEALRKRNTASYRTILELGGQLTLELPGLLLPLSSRRFAQYTHPQTIISLAYNYQRRPDYTRTIASAGFSYSWKNNFGLSQALTPAEANVVHILNITENFAEHIRQTYLGYSYQSQIITVTSYSLGYAKTATTERPHGVAFKFNVELSGNTLYGFNKWLSKPNENGQYEIAGLPFSQYVRTDINTTYSYVMAEGQTLAMRLYGGIGVPYLNSKALPFEKRFFEGGANGVRAWNARDLGPGAYTKNQLTYPNQTGDIKLEANIEFRSHLFWKFESALFVDAGNIWILREETSRPGADFKVSSFIQQVAIGYGAGLRLNLGFFILRLDAGLRLHDPADASDSEETKGHWLPFERPYGKQDWALHFGVGYPF